jgi:hypothetical protein
MENLLPVLDAKLLPESQLKPVHLAAVGFMIMSAKVQQAVQDQLRDFLVKR